MTNNTQESHMLKFFVVPHLGNKLQVDTKWLMHKNKSWLLFHNSFQCWQLVCISHSHPKCKQIEVCWSRKFQNHLPFWNSSFGSGFTMLPLTRNDSFERSTS
jgi:hypothetical protein